MTLNSLIVIITTTHWIGSLIGNTAVIEEKNNILEQRGYVLVGSAGPTITKWRQAGTILIRQRHPLLEKA